MSAPDKTPSFRDLTLQALDAQVRLLPYALGFFLMCLPVLLCTAAFAPNHAWLGYSLGLYAVNWTLFYAVVDWLKKAPAEGRNLALRARIQFGGSALWAAAMAQTAWVALGAGPASELILLECVGASAGIIFFSAPSFWALVFCGPAAAAGPVLALLSRPQTHHAGLLAMSASALVLALALILNRHLREHFQLAAEHLRMAREREAALAKAQATAKSKSDLVSTLSHEIRNGLTGVTHVLSGAMTAGRGAPSREQLRSALEAAKALGEALDATLDAESAEAGRLAVEAKPFDLQALLQDVVMLHRPAASAKGLELIVRAADFQVEGKGAVVADAVRVRQVLNNLIGNAVKYTNRGRIDASVVRSAGNRLRIDIADTGPGLTDEELSQAFQPFKRVLRTGAGVPGAGLGLPLSKRFAELMGGQLGADSTPGVGSRFWLALPFDPEAVPPSEPAEGESERPMRVLVVEDDALHAAMLRAALEQLGHRVLHVQEGGRALELLEIGPVDLIMLDGRMPGMDGPETARRLRALPDARADLPIVAVIGGDSIEAAEMVEAGVDAVLRKPVAIAGVARAMADAAAARREAPARSAAA